MPGDKILFLDRDGVINIDTGHPHIITEIRFVEGIFDLCKTASKLGYKIIIITNQAGIAKGYYSVDQFLCVMDWMIDEFQQRDIEILDYYYCPHHSDGLGKYKKNCTHRKPEPGMIFSACSDHNIDLNKSVIIGDKMSDMEAGNRASIGSKILLAEECDKEIEASNDISCFTKLSQVKQFLKNDIDRLGK